MYTLDDLRYLMTRLRDPKDGCPWDLKQSYDSIVPHTLEESYEVADAIERGDLKDLKDELGDLMFQVVFYSQLGAEDKAFTMDDVIDGITRKLLRRHPHVFPDGTLESRVPDGVTISEEDIKQQWERIKADERALKDAESVDDEAEFTPSKHSLLKDIPNAMPALNRAEKLQKRASVNGFDWQELGSVLDKVDEELTELRAELKKFENEDLRAPHVHQRLLDEMGDVLFCCVNLSRFIKVNPEEALRSTNQKFIRRFEHIERELFSEQREMKNVDLDELDMLWDSAKKRESLNKA